MKNIIEENDANFQDKVQEFFKRTDRILYVTKNNKLIGIISLIDYNKYKETERYINRDYKYIREDDENKVKELGERIFIEYKNISEIPVLNTNGEVIYVLLRKGDALDVLPRRFCELYGNDKGLSDFLSNQNKERIRIKTFNSEILEEYFLKYPLKKGVECICGADLKWFDFDIEEILWEYEKEIFKKRLEGYSRKFFLEYPVGTEMKSLNEDEKNRVLNAATRTNQFYLYNYHCMEEIKNLAKEVLGKNNCQEFVDELKITSQYIWKEGLCYNRDLKGKYVNVINGRRITMNVPIEPKYKLYLFGPCTVYGVLVDDGQTIASFLQKKINVLNENWEVVNEGMMGTPLIEQIRKFNRREYGLGDIFVFVLRNGEEKNMIQEMFFDEKIHSLTKCFDSFSFHNYFFDLPVHCNYKGCEKIAEYIYDIVENCLACSEKRQGGELGKKLTGERKNQEVVRYVKSISKFYRKGKNGAIVMNCNPYTKGHHYLIETASAVVDNLYVFVVSEDKSTFSFEDRFSMVKNGVRDLKNVVVLPSGKFILSADTFPEYFIKDTLGKEVVIDTSNDLNIFCDYIAPELQISVRFVGEEPIDFITSQYNRDMKYLLPLHGIAVNVIPRATTSSGKIISASIVRKLYNEKRWAELEEFVPKSTFEYLVTIKEGGGLRTC